MKIIIHGMIIGGTLFGSDAAFNEGRDGRDLLGDAKRSVAASAQHAADDFTAAIRQLVGRAAPK